MGWIIYFIVNTGVTVAIVPQKHWKRLWLAGAAGMALIFAIDSILVGLGAFMHMYGESWLGGLPILYWVSAFPQGIFVAYLYPEERRELQVPYLLIMASIIWVMEVIMIYTGYFVHFHWNLLKSFFLNLAGLSTFITLVRAVGAVGKKETGNRIV